MSELRVEYPLILLNLKTYEQSTGSKAIHLAKIAENVSEETGVCIAVAPQSIDLKTLSESVEIPVFAQHIDPITYGKNTGHILPDALKIAGASGTLISHSERRLELEGIESRIKRAKESSLVQVVCVDTIERGRLVAPFNPDSIAIEPPELIGTGISVSKAQPEIVSGSVDAVHELNSGIKVLCGAGITNGNDVVAAIKLGAEGVLVASGVIKAEDPGKILMELAEAIHSIP
jgi:triosephosphate isomerase